MLFINDKLNAQLNVVEQNDELFFNLYEVASNLGYAKPDRAIRTFLANNSEIKIEDPGVLEGLLVEEWVLYLFLMESKALRAKEFKLWVAKEVLPAVRQVGIRAVKQLAIAKRIKECPKITKVELADEGYSQDLIDEAVESFGSYRQLGFLPLTEFIGATKHKNFYHVATVQGFILDTGEIHPRFAHLTWDGSHLFSSKYINGKWYAFKQEFVEAVLGTKEDFMELSL